MEYSLLLLLLFDMLYANLTHTYTHTLLLLLYIHRTVDEEGEFDEEEDM